VEAPLQLSRVADPCAHDPALGQQYPRIPAPGPAHVELLLKHFALAGVLRCGAGEARALSVLLPVTKEAPAELNGAERGAPDRTPLRERALLAALILPGRAAGPLRPLVKAGKPPDVYADFSHQAL
jgi:hypothetical protein